MKDWPFNLKRNLSALKVFGLVDCLGEQMGLFKVKQ